MTADDLWDVSQRGTSKLHVNWGGYRVSLELPIDLDEAHRYDCVVMVDMHLSAWGETKPTFNKVARPLVVGKDIRGNGVGDPMTLKRVRAKPRLTPPHVPSLRPKASSENS